VPAAVRASTPVPKHLINPSIPKIEDPDSVVHRYLEAVDRGELEIFGQKVDRAMIVPTRVEYAYDLSSRETQIRVHANLKEPLPVPGRLDCQILSVSASLEDGHITVIESHVWMK
jgi:hypothetical protein